MKKGKLLKHIRKAREKAGLNVNQAALQSKKAGGRISNKGSLTQTSWWRIENQMDSVNEITATWDTLFVMAAAVGLKVRVDFVAHRPR